MTDTFDMTLRELIEFAKESNSAFTQINTAKGDKVQMSICVIIGEEECQELLPAIEKITDKWNE